MTPCLSCRFLNDGCDVETQVCRLVALLYPSALITKTLANVMYEAK